MPVYEPLFAEKSYGYRPNRSAKDTILKVKEYAEQGYTCAVSLDLSKYFDTLNHEILINLLRKNVKDERVVQMIKHYLKSGVMENGVVMETEEGVSKELAWQAAMSRRGQHQYRSRHFRYHLRSQNSQFRPVKTVYSSYIDNISTSRYDGFTKNSYP